MPRIWQRLNLLEGTSCGFQLSGIWKAAFKMNPNGSCLLLAFTPLCKPFALDMDLLICFKRINYILNNGMPLLRLGCKKIEASVLGTFSLFLFLFSLEAFNKDVLIDTGIVPFIKWNFGMVE